MSFPSQSPLYFATNRERYERQIMIKQIQDLTQRKLIIYVSNFNNPLNMINGDDLVPFSELLHSLPKNSKIDLMLHSPGGSVDAAESLINAVLTKTDDFRVIVPYSAKSAATMMALAANEILMGPYSELGPIDPQITIPTPNGPLSSPAKAFLNGLEKIKHDVVDNGGNLNAAYFPLLNGLNPAIMHFCDMQIKHGINVAQRFLQRAMFAKDPQGAQDLATRLMDVDLFPSHGAVINAARAHGMGLKVKEYSQDDEFWEAVWRLYCIYDVTLRKEQLVKMFESESAMASI